MNTTEILNSTIQNYISNNCNLGENKYRIKDCENTLLKKQGAGVYLYLFYLYLFLKITELELVEEG